MVKIGIIINPNSKRIKKMKTDPVQLYKSAGGDSVEIRLTKNEADIVKAAKDFKKQNISYLAISGGDGSIHLVISIFISVYKNNRLPFVLILRDGSMNLLARSYKLKGKGEDILKRLLNALHGKKKIEIVQRDTIKVNNMYCFMFGMGLTTNYISEFNKGGNKSRLKAIKVIFIALWQFLTGNNKGIFSRMNLRVFTDGKELWLKDILAIYAATIANLIVGFTPAPRAYDKKGTFHLIITGMNPVEIFFNFNKLRRGIKVSHSSHYDNIASDLKIMHPGKFHYQMDGDIYEAKDKLIVTAGPVVGFVKV